MFSLKKTIVILNVECWVLVFGILGVSTIVILGAEYKSSASSVLSIIVILGAEYYCYHRCSVLSTSPRHRRCWVLFLSSVFEYYCYPQCWVLITTSWHPRCWVLLLSSVFSTTVILGAESWVLVLGILGVEYYCYLLLSSVLSTIAILCVECWVQY